MGIAYHIPSVPHILTMLIFLVAPNGKPAERIICVCPIAYQLVTADCLEIGKIDDFSGVKYQTFYTKTYVLTPTSAPCQINPNNVLYEPRYVL